MKQLRSVLVLTALFGSAVCVAQAETPAHNDERARLKTNSGQDQNSENTERNVRDRNHSTVLPGDQSNKSQFIDRTAAIRRDLMAQSVSITAKNIKIITLEDGTVVLRGPVTSAEEKKIIEDIAHRLAGSDPVVSYLEF